MLIKSSNKYYTIDNTFTYVISSNGYDNSYLCIAPTEVAAKTVLNEFLNIVSVHPFHYVTYAPNKQGSLDIVRKYMLGRVLQNYAPSDALVMTDYDYDILETVFTEAATDEILILQLVHVDKYYLKLLLSIPASASMLQPVIKECTVLANAYATS